MQTHDIIVAVAVTERFYQQPDVPKRWRRQNTANNRLTNLKDLSQIIISKHIIIESLSMAIFDEIEYH